MWQKANMTTGKYKIIVIGASAGGREAFLKVLSPLPEDFPIPIVVVQHVHPTQNMFFIEDMNNQCRLAVKQAEEKEAIQRGKIYFAPPDYHLLIEEDKTFSLSFDEKVNYARPSIDVLFESAADAYASEIIGIILTGANFDGANGLKLIKNSGGLAIVQNPEEAESPTMPKGAINMTKVDHILTLKEIEEFLKKLVLF